MRARDQSSIFRTGGKFCPDYGLLLGLQALTLVACSYARQGCPIQLATSHIHTYTLPQTDPGHLETFQSLLRDNPCVFHACRTATSLHHHWVLMGHYNLLNNQKGSVGVEGTN